MRGVALLPPLADWLLTGWFPVADCRILSGAPPMDGLLTVCSCWGHSRPGQEPCVSLFTVFKMLSRHPQTYLNILGPWTSCRRVRRCSRGVDALCTSREALTKALPAHVMEEKGSPGVFQTIFELQRRSPDGRKFPKWKKKGRISADGGVWGI